MPPSREMAFSWSVCVERSNLQMGMLFLGVCDLTATCGWGLCPFDGKLHRISRSGTSGAVNYLEPPPTTRTGASYPDGHRTRVLGTSASHNLVRPTTWSSLGCGDGTILECTVDSGGRMSFCIDDFGPFIVPDFAFPPDVPLRKWCFVPDKRDVVVEVVANADTFA